MFFEDKVECSESDENELSEFNLSTALVSS